MHDNRIIETEIYYKTTNNHHYLEYNSFHPTHIKENIPYNLAKRIIVFTSNPQKETEELQNLRKWLLDSDYPPAIINKAFHNAKLQGPAPDPKKKAEIIPFVTEYCTNFTNNGVVKKANMLLQNCPDMDTKKCFENKKIVMAYRQPPNILRELTSAKFDSVKIITKPKGIFKCNDKKCKICNLYMIECKSFKVADNETWEVPTHITCQSTKVLYFQICTGCDHESNVGKTNNLRYRINNHISSCRLGTSTDKFDNHVYHCKRDNNEPYFKLMVLMEVNEIEKLLIYEDYFHKRGFDTINRSRAKTQ